MGQAPFFNPGNPLILRDSTSQAQLGIVAGNVVQSPDGAVQTPVGNANTDWFGAMMNLFQARTGLQPSQFSKYREEDFVNTAQGINIAGGQNPVGTGAAVAFAQPSMLRLTGPSSGAGAAAWQINTSGLSPIPSLLFKRHMFAARLAAASVPNANSRVTVGYVSGSNFYGIGWAGAQTKWFCMNGSTPSQQGSALSSASIDSGGLLYLTVYVGNFDFVNMAVNPGFYTGEVESNPLQWQSLSPITNASPVIWVNGTGAADVINVDKVVCFTENV